MAAGALEIRRGDPLAESFSAVVANFVVGLDGLAVLAHVLIRLGNVKPGRGSVVAFEQLLGKEFFEFFDGPGVLAFLFEDDAPFESGLNGFGMVGREENDEKALEGWLKCILLHNHVFSIEKRRQIHSASSDYASIISKHESA